jgi:hypothetical protein
MYGLMDKQSTKQSFSLRDDFKEKVLQDFTYVFYLEVYFRIPHNLTVLKINFLLCISHFITKSYFKGTVV